MHIDNKNKNILILVEGPTQGLDDATLIAKAIYPINFTQPIHYNGSNTIMEATTYLLMLRKYINSKQKTLK